MQIRFLQGLAILVLTGCLTPDKKNLNDPQWIVDQAIEVYGGDKFENAEIRFTFRDRDYVSIRNQGSYQYERLFEENGNSVRDVLNNQGFYREINGSRAEIPDTMAIKYTNSVNSVIYFAVLPFGLNDPAVRKEYLGQVFIQKVPYHKIRVTFDQQGGGEDFQDVFIYWFRTDNYWMDYFAYRYYTEEGGIRFRRAFNTRNVNGLWFSDYTNYKVDPAQYKVEESDRLFEENKIEELSEIELENITVK